VKRLLPMVLPLCSALLLAGCGGGSGSVASTPALPGGGAPALPTGAEVRHPAAPVGNPVYLSLMSDADESFYQVAVKAGDTVTAINPVKWRGKEVGKTVDVSTLIPAGAVQAPTSASQVLLLHWAMWQDANSNGARDAGETLPLLSHDRAVYSDKAGTATFRTATPNMDQNWNFTQGWSRAAHYVYLPEDSSAYQRSLASDPVQRYELHEPTDITSQ
jgi:hypothetical protein